MVFSSLFQLGGQWNTLLSKLVFSSTHILSGQFSVAHVEIISLRPSEQTRESREVEKWIKKYICVYLDLYLRAFLPKPAQLDAV